MKNQIIVIVAFLIALVGCSQEKAKQEIIYPYKFLQERIDSSGKGELYSYSGQIDVENLKSFCKTKKEGYKDSGFLSVVIFDDEKNAVFPKSPMSAMYGTEETPQKHIRAFYTYNNVNGYSELLIYEKNQWDSKAQKEKI